jgi:hypothetical protein
MKRVGKPPEKLDRKSLIGSVGCLFSFLCHCSASEAVGSLTMRCRRTRPSRPGCNPRVPWAESLRSSLASLPLRMNNLCGASSSHRVSLSMRFLFIGSSVSHSLPSPARLPSRSWLLVMISFMFSCLGFLTGDSHPICNAPMLGAHLASGANGLPLSLQTVAHFERR